MAKLVVIESCNECKYLYPKIGRCKHPYSPNRKITDDTIIPGWCPLENTLQPVIWKRKCPRCGLEKDNNEFYYRKETDNYHSTCKVCQRRERRKKYVKECKNGKIHDNK